MLDSSSSYFDNFEEDRREVPEACFVGVPVFAAKRSVEKLVHR